jgi:hypothetical protein
LSELREQFQTQRASLRRLQFHSQETLATYRQRITTLLRVNAHQVFLRHNQLLAVRLEIMALKETIRLMRRELNRHDIDIPAPSFSPWELALMRSPATWIVSPFWEDHHSGEMPDFNPNLSIEEEGPSEPMN